MGCTAEREAAVQADVAVMLRLGLKVAEVVRQWQVTLPVQHGSMLLVAVARPSTEPIRRH